MGGGVLVEQGGGRSMVVLASSVASLGSCRMRWGYMVEPCRSGCSSETQSAVW